MKNAFLVIGGWEGHAPEQSADVFAPLLEEAGFEVRRENTLDACLDKTLLESQDLTVPIWIPGRDHRQAAGKSAEGRAFGHWHGRVARLHGRFVQVQSAVPVYGRGQWVSHPGGIIDCEVNITALEDPITQGHDGFWMHSEQYYIHADPSNEVLATTTFNGDQAGQYWIKGVEMPVCWKR